MIFNNVQNSVKNCRQCKHHEEEEEDEEKG